MQNYDEKDQIKELIERLENFKGPQEDKGPDGNQADQIAIEALKAQIAVQLIDLKNQIETDQANKLANLKNQLEAQLTALKDKIVALQATDAKVDVAKADAKAADDKAIAA